VLFLFQLEGDLNEVQSKLIASKESVSNITAKLDPIEVRLYIYNTTPNLLKLTPGGHDRQSLEQNNRKLISLNNNGKDDKHAHGFADF
jgi:hypothetical protein